MHYAISNNPPEFIVTLYVWYAKLPTVFRLLFLTVLSSCTYQTTDSCTVVRLVCRSSAEKSLLTWGGQES